MLSALFALLPLLPLILSLELAGNENYARDASRLLRRSKERRSTYVPTFQPESVSFTIGSKEYLSPTGGEFKSYTLDNDFGLESYVGKSMLVTVIPVDGNVTCDALGKKVDEYTKMDDVWDKGFMQALVLTSSGSYHVDSEVAGCLKGWGGDLIVKSGSATSSVSDIGLAHVTGDSVPPGPYYAKISSSLRLTPVYRSFKDEQQAFTAATIQTTNNTFVDLSTPLAGLNTISIPVPSRLYTAYMPNPRPLEGRRVAVKDLFDMAGMRTGGGSRAYWNTYPERQKTAFAVQKMIDQGAIIIGRTKSSQFANGESATADWVDQMCPFNPRGDGYQQPSSSSSGSGASIASYDWLDNTIGSDTGGSITGPAGVQGVYGMRPTFGAISLEGAIPLQVTQDTAGAFDRSAVRGAAFVKGWYGDKFKNYTSMPSTLIFPNSSWTFSANSTTGPIFTKFRSALVDYLKPSTIETQDFEGFWNSSGRYQTYNSTSSTYLARVYGTLISYYQYTNFGRPWIADYSAQNDGRVPFISPSPLVRWNFGRNNVTESIFNEALGKKQVYEDFIKSTVLQSDDTRCSRAIYLEPSTFGTPSYRNAYRNATTVPLSGVYVAQFAGIPQLVVPIGQAPYTSTITNKTEYLPVTVSMYAAAGCDYLLWDIAAALETSGALTAVKTGRAAYWKSRPLSESSKKRSEESGRSHLRP